MIKLSIITPYHDCLDYIKKLADILIPQLTEEIEWIIIDDGDNEKYLDTLNATVIHLPNNTGCAGIPRNHGLDIAKGEYITFVDADDCVRNDFVEQIINKINTSDFDYCLTNWEFIFYNDIVDVTNGRPFWNRSVWGIIYKKDLIGNTRFNNSRIGEDDTFLINVLKGKEEKLLEPIYIYNYNPNGLSKKEVK